MCLIALGLTTSCSNSAESGGSSGGDEILKSVECVTVLGLNEALEVHYQSGRIEIVTTGGSVDITSGVSGINDDPNKVKNFKWPTIKLQLFDVARQCDARCNEIQCLHLIASIFHKIEILLAKPAE